MIKRNNTKGFTIVELVIVIAVIAILAAVLIPTFAGIVNKANKSTIGQEARAALTVILAEEDAQMSADADYYFLYVDEDEITYFEYADGELAEIKAVALDKLDANDTLWYADGNSAIVTDTKISDTKKLIGSASGVPAGIRTPLADLSDNILVIKVANDDDNAAFTAAEDALDADTEALGTVKAINAGDAIVYAQTEDTAIDEEKTYYTFSDDTYTVVATPDVNDIGTYYEATYVAKGSFSGVSADGYTYTYVAGGYTYVYVYTAADSASAWTITKN